MFKAHKPSNADQLRWISVEDCLPPQHDAVLVASRVSFKDGYQVDIAHWEELDNYGPSFVLEYTGEDHIKKVGTVDFWMPLPVCQKKLLKKIHKEMVGRVIRRDYRRR